jgi:hypothetical protein
LLAIGSRARISSPSTVRNVGAFTYGRTNHDCWFRRALEWNVFGILRDGKSRKSSSLNLITDVSAQEFHGARRQNQTGRQRYSVHLRAWSLALYRIDIWIVRGNSFKDVRNPLTIFYDVAAFRKAFCVSYRHAATGKQDSWHNIIKSNTSLEAFTWTFITVVRYFSGWRIDSGIQATRATHA